MVELSSKVNCHVLRTVSLDH